jgi:cell wall-associated NlpC family hydrolase
VAVPIRRFIDVARSQHPKPYVYAAEASPLNPSPRAFDCSELVEWAAARVGVTVPDGAYYQWRHVRRISVNEAIRLPGALLFVGDGTGVGRSAITHCAISLGDGTTIEARGSKWGIGTWGAYGRFNFGGYLPGFDYRTVPVKPPANQGGGITLHPGATKSQAVEFMQVLLNIVREHQGGKVMIQTSGTYGAQTSAAVKEFKEEVNATFRPNPRLVVNHTADPTMLRWLAWCVSIIV